METERTETEKQGKTTVSFGRHNGKTFMGAREDKSYCAWVMNQQDDSSPMLKRFQRYFFDCRHAQMKGTSVSGDGKSVGFPIPEHSSQVFHTCAKRCQGAQACRR